MRKKERQIEIESTKLGGVTFIDICGTYEWTAGSISIFNVTRLTPRSKKVKGTKRVWVEREDG